MIVEPPFKNHSRDKKRQTQRHVVGNFGCFFQLPERGIWWTFVAYKESH